mmetsp:Transcript_26592/g.52409  ORF Transcript_26592/g.52409 Transcript_26592/m.52409 type:complete len:538 (-) Transcript_26592:185-1798(-)|eukprot:CAMPEP_0175128956 /NCGR_PEP_ID=MMETSP0087-20121206/5208_1 /TAXON_ID=136419 /ORGANISM="Unknown Unknown, Strain D1" /LENGTH=537 /DNA_ID=CAMNT_0016411059 /DNA_START=92 /DNA_END=1705 /DNA_ORIENTATION=-
MASPYKKVEIKRFPKKNPHVTPETRYWQDFGKAVKNKANARITNIEFCPTAPYDFAVTCSTRVDVYNHGSCTLKKSISRFQDIAYSGSFRADGKLLVAGSANGDVKVFDMASRGILRTWSEHKGECHVARFSADNQHIISAADDKTVKVLSLPTETCLSTLTGHADYIRCSAESPTSIGTWFTGSYDHKIKCWDTRANMCVMTMEHGDPLEDILILPSGGLLLSAGGTELKVWDLMAGGKLVDTLCNHQKALTSLCLDAGATRVISGSLDHQVKIYDIATFGVTHSFVFDAEVTSVALSPDNTSLAVGMLDGTLEVRKRETKVAAPTQERREPRTGTKRFFMRGQHHVPLQEDYQVESSGKKQKLRPYDRFLMKFQYHTALDVALQTRQAPVVVSVVEELVARGALRLALAGRNDVTLQPLLNFLLKQIDNPQHSSLLLDVTNIVLDMYSRVVGQSVVVDETLHKLKVKVSAEVGFQKTATELLGTLGILLASATDGDAAAASSAPLTSMSESIVKSPALPPSSSESSKGAAKKTKV